MSAFADTLRGLEEKPRWLPELLDFNWAHILDSDGGSDGGTLYDNFLPWLEAAVQGKKGVEVHASPLFQEIFTAMGQKPLAEARLIPLVDLKLKKAVHDPAAKRAASRCIVKHLSEWAEGDGVWPALTEALQPVCGDRERQHLECQNERIAQLEFFSQCKGIEGFPASGEVYHIHPIGLLGQVEALNSEPFEMYASAGPLPPPGNDDHLIDLLEHHARRQGKIAQAIPLVAKLQDRAGGASISTRVPNPKTALEAFGELAGHFAPEALDQYIDSLTDGDLPADIERVIQDLEASSTAQLEYVAELRDRHRPLTPAQRREAQAHIEANRQYAIFYEHMRAITRMAERAQFIRDEAEAIHEEVELSWTGPGGKFEQSALAFGLGDVATDEANRVSLEYGDPKGLVALWDEHRSDAQEYAESIEEVVAQLQRAPLDLSPQGITRTNANLRAVRDRIKGVYTNMQPIEQEITAHRSTTELGG